MITVSALVTLVIWLIVAGLIFWLVNWLITTVGIPEPFNKIARVIAAIVAFLVVLNALLTLAGSPIFVLR